MKNLLIYINPSGFTEETAEYERLTRLQIDNSLELGWNKKDIILVTNFPYQYNGIISIIIPTNKAYIPAVKVDCATKIKALLHLFDTGFFGSDLYWYHDIDAYQQEPISEEELELESVDAGFCDYCRIPKWQLGSFFFKKKAERIFRAIAKIMGIGGGENKTGINDEDAMVYLTNNNIDNINSRIKRLNGRYDFGMRRVDYCYGKAKKPLKVLHFHPHNPLINTLAIAMYGKNRIRKPLMNSRLIRIFNKYGYS